MTHLRPERLIATNVTPPTRTPWGGRRLAARYKPSIGLPTDEPVGEAWEISVEPSFPSRIERTGDSLDRVIATDPEGWLGKSVSWRFGGQLSLLVKLLDAAADLSVQVHPSDDDPQLADDESGKPEAWIVLEASRGAGIYLGFKDGVDRGQVETALSSGEAIDRLLNFVQVAPGDVYQVDAGTVHAIGAGVTLLEPQHVLPGRRGLTYRFWDWNRRYDDLGRPDPQGQPRELHVARALDVTRWDAPRGKAFVDSCRRKPALIEHQGEMLRWGLLVNDWFAAERWQGDGQLQVGFDSLLGLVCTAGRARIRSRVHDIELSCGHSAVVPAGLREIEVEGEGLELFACRPIA